MKKYGVFYLFAIFIVLFLQAALASNDQTSNDIEKIFSYLKEKTLEKSYDLQSTQALNNQKSAQIYTSITHWFPQALFRQLSLTKI
ncbi:MAG: hypothetical protein HY072_06085 [Deltaproteobacteria bacterium]|nr:hypothetical protein [Deltaproteobacteria bacterium]